MGHAFVVVTLPAKDTILGSLTYEAAARVELWASPKQDDEFGEFYAFALHASGVSDHEAMEAAHRMQDACVIFDSDAITDGVWHARGWIPVQNIAHRSFRLLKRLPHGTAPAWVVLQDGLAQVRLRPFTSAPMEEYLNALASFLKQEGVEADVDLVDLDGQTYRVGLAELDRLPKQIPGLLFA